MFGGVNVKLLNLRQLPTVKLTGGSIMLWGGLLLVVLVSLKWMIKKVKKKETPNVSPHINNKTVDTI